MARRKKTHRIWKKVSEIGFGEAAAAAPAGAGTTSANVGAYPVPIGDVPDWQKKKKKTNEKKKRKKTKKVQPVHQMKVPGMKAVKSFM